MKKCHGSGIYREFTVWDFLYEISHFWVVQLRDMSQKGQGFLRWAQDLLVLFVVAALIVSTSALTVQAQDAPISGCGGKGVYSAQCTGKTFCNGKQYGGYFYLDDNCQVVGKGSPKATKDGIVGKSCGVSGATKSFGGGKCCQLALCSNPQTQDGKPLGKNQEELAKDLRGRNLDPQSPPSSGSGQPGIKQEPTELQKTLEQYYGQRSLPEGTFQSFDEKAVNEALIQEANLHSIPVEYVTDPKTGEVTISPDTIKALENLAAPENIGSLQPPDPSKDGKPALWESSLFNDGNTFGGGPSESEAEKSVLDKARDLANDLWGKVTDFAGGIACGIGSAVGVGSCGAPLAAEVPPQENLGGQYPPISEPEAPPQPPQKTDDFNARNPEIGPRHAEGIEVSKLISEFNQEVDRRGNLTPEEEKRSDEKLDRIEREIAIWERGHQNTELGKHDLKVIEAEQKLADATKDVPLNEEGQFSCASKAQCGAIEQAQKSYREAVQRQDEYIDRLSKTATYEDLQKQQQFDRERLEAGISRQDDSARQLELEQKVEALRQDLPLMSETERRDTLQKFLAQERSVPAEYNDLLKQYEFKVDPETGRVVAKSNTDFASFNERASALDQQISLSQQASRAIEQGGGLGKIPDDTSGQYYDAFGNQYGTPLVAQTQDILAARAEFLGQQVSAIEYAGFIAQRDGLEFARGQYIDLDGKTVDFSYRAGESFPGATDPLNKNIRDIQAIQSFLRNTDDPNAYGLAQYLNQPATTPEELVRRGLVMQALNDAYKSDLYARYIANPDAPENSRGLSRPGDYLAGIATPEALAAASIRERDFRYGLVDQLTGVRAETPHVTKMIDNALGRNQTWFERVENSISNFFHGYAERPLDISREVTGSNFFNDLSGLPARLLSGFAGDVVDRFSSVGSSIANIVGVDLDPTYRILQSEFTQTPNALIVGRVIDAGLLAIDATLVAPVFRGVGEGLLGPQLSRVGEGVGGFPGVTRLASGEFKLADNFFSPPVPISNTVARLEAQAADRAAFQDIAGIYRTQESALTRVAESPVLSPRSSVLGDINNNLLQTTSRPALDVARGIPPPAAVAPRVNFGSSEALGGRGVGTELQQAYRAGTGRALPDFAPAPSPVRAAPSLPAPQSVAPPAVARTSTPVSRAADAVYQNAIGSGAIARAELRALSPQLESAVAAEIRANQRLIDAALSREELTRALQASERIPAERAVAAREYAQHVNRINENLASANKQVAQATRELETTALKSNAPAIRNTLDDMANARAMQNQGRALSEAESKVASNLEKNAQRRLETAVTNEQVVSRELSAASKNLQDARARLQNAERELSTARSSQAGRDLRVLDDAARARAGALAEAEARISQQSRALADARANVAKIERQLEATAQNIPRARVDPFSSAVNRVAERTQLSGLSRVRDVLSPASVRNEVRSILARQALGPGWQGNGLARRDITARLINRYNFGTPVSRAPTLPAARPAIYRSSPTTARGIGSPVTVNGRTFTIAPPGSRTGVPTARPATSRVPNTSVPSVSRPAAPSTPASRPTAGTPARVETPNVASRPAAPTPARIETQSTPAPRPVTQVAGESAPARPTVQRNPGESLKQYVDRVVGRPAPAGRPAVENRAAAPATPRGQVVTPPASPVPDRPSLATRSASPARPNTQVVSPAPAPATPPRAAAPAARPNTSVVQESPTPRAPDNSTLAQRLRNLMMPPQRTARPAPSVNRLAERAGSGAEFSVPDRAGGIDSVPVYRLRDNELAQYRQLESAGKIRRRTEGEVSTLAQAPSGERWVYVSGEGERSVLARVTDDQFKTITAPLSEEQLNEVANEARELAGQIGTDAQVGQSAVRPTPRVTTLGGIFGALGPMYEVGGVVGVVRYVLRGSPAASPQTTEAAINDLTRAARRQGITIELIEQPSGLKVPENPNYYGLDQIPYGRFTLKDNFENLNEWVNDWGQRYRIIVSDAQTGELPSTRKLLAFRNLIEEYLPASNDINENNKLRLSPMSGAKSAFEAVANNLEKVDTPAAKAIVSLYKELPVIGSSQQYEDMSLTERVAMTKTFDSVMARYADILSGTIPEVASAKPVIRSSSLTPQEERRAQSNVGLHAVEKDAGAVTVIPGEGVVLNEESGAFLEKFWTENLKGGRTREDIFRSIAKGSESDIALVRASANGDSAGLLAEIERRVQLGDGAESSKEVPIATVANEARQLAEKIRADAQQTSLASRVTQSSVGRWVRGAVTGALIAFGGITELPARNAVSGVLGLGPQGTSIARTVVDSSSVPANEQQIKSVSLASPVTLPRVNAGPKIDFNVTLDEVYRQSRVRFGKHPGTDKYPWAKYTAEQRAQAVAYQTNNPGGMKWPFIFELMGSPTGKAGPYAELFNVAKMGPDGQVRADSIHPGKINIIPSKTPFVTFATFSDAVGAMAAKAAYQKAYRNLGTFDDMIRTWVAKDNVSPYLDAGSYANQAKVSGATKLVRDASNRLEIAQMATIAKGIPLAEYNRLFQKANVVDPVTNKPVATAEDLLTPEVLRDGLMKVYGAAEADSWYKRVTGKDAIVLTEVKVPDKLLTQATQQRPAVKAPSPAPKNESLARSIDRQKRAEMRADEEKEGVLGNVDNIVQRTLVGIMKAQTTRPGLDRMPDMVQWLRTTDSETRTIARAIFAGRTGAHIDKEGWISLPKETQAALLRIGIEFEVRPWEGRRYKGIARTQITSDKYIVQHEFRNKGGEKSIERTIRSHQNAKGDRFGVYVDFYVSEPVERLSSGKIGVKIVQIKPVWEYSIHASNLNSAGIGVEHAKNANDSFDVLGLLADAVLTDALKQWKPDLKILPHWAGGTEGAGIATFLNQREARLSTPNPEVDSRRFAAAIRGDRVPTRFADSVEWHKVTIYSPESLAGTQFNFNEGINVVPGTVAVLAPGQRTLPPGENRFANSEVVPPFTPAVDESPFSRGPVSAARTAEERSLQALAEIRAVPKPAPQEAQVAENRSTPRGTQPEEFAADVVSPSLANRVQEAVAYVQNYLSRANESYGEVLARLSTSRPQLPATQGEILEPGVSTPTPSESESALVRPGDITPPERPVAPQQDAAGQAKGDLPLLEKPVAPQQPVAGQADGDLPLLERPVVPVEVPVAKSLEEKQREVADLTRTREANQRSVQIESGKLAEAITRFNNNVKDEKRGIPADARAMQESGKRGDLAGLRRAFNNAKYKGDQVIRVLDYLNKSPLVSPGIKEEINKAMALTETKNGWRPTSLLAMEGALSRFEQLPDVNPFGSGPSKNSSQEAFKVRMEQLGEQIAEELEAVESVVNRAKAEIATALQERKEGVKELSTRIAALQNEINTEIERRVAAAQPRPPAQTETPPPPVTKVSNAPTPKEADQVAKAIEEGLRKELEDIPKANEPITRKVEPEEVEPVPQQPSLVEPELTPPSAPTQPSPTLAERVQGVWDGVGEYLSRANETYRKALTERLGRVVSDGVGTSAPKPAPPLPAGRAVAVAPRRDELTPPPNELEGRSPESVSQPPVENPAVPRSPASEPTSEPVSTPDSSPGVIQENGKEVTPESAPTKPALFPSDNQKVSAPISSERLLSSLYDTDDVRKSVGQTVLASLFDTAPNERAISVPVPKSPTRDPVLSNGSTPTPSPRITEGTPLPPSNGGVPTPPPVPPRTPPAFLGDPSGPGSSPPPSAQRPLLSLWWARIAALLNQDSQDDEEKRRDLPRLSEPAPRIAVTTVQIPMPVLVPRIEDGVFTDKQFAGTREDGVQRPPIVTPDGEPQLVEGLKLHDCKKDPEPCKAAGIEERVVLKEEPRLAGITPTEEPKEKPEEKGTTIIGNTPNNDGITSIRPKETQSETPADKMSPKTTEGGSKDPSSQVKTPRTTDTQTPGTGGKRTPNSGGDGGGGGGSGDGGGSGASSGGGSSGSGSGVGVLSGLLRGLMNFFSKEISCFFNSSQPQCVPQQKPATPPVAPIPISPPTSTSTPLLPLPVRYASSTVTLIAVPGEVNEGEASRLRWASTNMTSCSVYQLDETLLAQGSTRGEVLTPKLSTSTSFYVECQNTTLQRISISTVTVQVR